MPAEVNDTDRSYRRGAIMGLTMAEAFILISFALLLLFGFWQKEMQKEITPEVAAFKKLSLEHRQTVLVAAQDGSLMAFAGLRREGVDFSSPASVELPQEKWRFIDTDDVRRLMDAASSLPEDMQRDLADLVEDEEAQKILSEMGALEALVESGQNIADLIASSDAAAEINDSGRSLDELLATAKILETLNNSGQTIDDLLATAQALEDIESAGQTLEGISSRIKNAEAQEAALVAALRSELGDMVAGVGGNIDSTGAIILPDTALFEQGKSHITPVLGRFLAQACGPWLAVLKNSGVDLSEVKIEGHASSEWRSQSTARQAYLGNLNLSQQRSQAVLRTCLDFVPDTEVLEWARKHLIAVGYSSVRPVLRDGLEDKAASRRVVFAATPNRKSLLEEIETQTQIARYDRNLFGGWADADEDCMNTRHEILASLSTQDVKLSRNKCLVVRGEWLDQYTGKTFTRARDVDIDHLVPLKWAWDRGAHSWSPERRAEFANDPVNLFPVMDQVNQDKGAKGPVDWLPPDDSFRCQYITRFMRVALEYNLQIPDAENARIAESRDDEC